MGICVTSYDKSTNSIGRARADWRGDLPLVAGASVGMEGPATHAYNFTRLWFENNWLPRFKEIIEAMLRLAVEVGPDRLTA